jgi:hypothetical protein
VRGLRRMTLLHWNTAIANGLKLTFGCLSLGQYSVRAAALPTLPGALAKHPATS